MCVTLYVTACTYEKFKLVIIINTIGKVYLSPVIVKYLRFLETSLSDGLAERSLLYHRARKHGFNILLSTVEYENTIKNDLKLS